MEKRTIYQDDKMTVEIPELLYRVFTSQRKLTSDELNTGIKAMKDILIKKDYPVDKNKRQFKIGSQIMFLQPLRFSTFTPEFEEVGMIYDALCIVRQELKEYSYRERQLFLAELEDVLEGLLGIKQLFVVFFKEPIGEMAGFIACGDNDLLKVLFIGYEKS